MKTAKNKTARKLWLLLPVEKRPEGRDPWASPWECVNGMVVCAASEAAARSIAQKHGGYENGIGVDPSKSPWLNPAFSTCAELTAEHPEGIVAIDYSGS